MAKGTRIPGSLLFALKHCNKQCSLNESPAASGLQSIAGIFVSKSTAGMCDLCI